MANHDSLSDPVTPNDLVRLLAHDREELNRRRTITERLGPDLMLALAFFTLGLTSNVVATLVPEESKPGFIFVSAVAGVIMLGFWSWARQHKSLDDELSNLERDAKFMAMISSCMVAVSVERQPGLGASNDSSARPAEH